MSIVSNTDCISRNIGDNFNLAVWRSGSKLPNFYHQIYINLLTILVLAVQLPNLIFVNIKINYSLILHKSPKLIIANISGYTARMCMSESMEPYMKALHVRTIHL